MNTNLGQLLQAIIDVIKTDALKTALPLIQAFIQNVIANPSQANVLAQVASLEVQLLAALPNLEQAVVKDVATLVQSQVAALEAQTGKPA